MPEFRFRGRFGKAVFNTNELYKREKSRLSFELISQICNDVWTQHEVVHIVYIFALVGGKRETLGLGKFLTQSE
jgi:hypothetical protein